jgi:hypothetical protein
MRNLKLTVLKVEHATKTEAEKLLEFIRGSDVYSIETACMSNARAEREEANWRVALKLSKAEFNKRREFTWVGYMTDDIRQYIRRRTDLLLQEKKPLLYLEHWPDSKVAGLVNDLNCFLRAEDMALDALMARGLDGFMKEMPGALSAGVSWMEKRDRNIAENLNSAETYIREGRDRYQQPRFSQQVREKETINLTIDIGAMHRPEKFIDKEAIQVEIEILIDRNKYKIGTTVLEQYDSKSFVPRDLLAYLILQIPTSRLPPIAPEILMEGSFDELHQVLKESLSP